MNLESLIDARVDARVAEVLRAPPGAAYVTQRTAPIPRRRFLAAVRRGEMPATKIGRTVVVRAADFDRWLAEHGEPAVQALAGDVEASVLAAVGLERVK